MELSPSLLWNVGGKIFEISLTGQLARVRSHCSNRILMQFGNTTDVVGGWFRSYPLKWAPETLVNSLNGSWGMIQILPIILA